MHVSHFRLGFHSCMITISIFITSILKSMVVPVIWLALIGAIYSRIAPFFALNRIFFPANEEVTLKTKQPIRFQGLFKVTNQIAGKWKTKSIMWEILVWNHTCDFKSNECAARVRFWNHAYDFSPNCTPLSSITTINHILKGVIWFWRQA